MNPAKLITLSWDIMWVGLAAEAMRGPLRRLGGAHDDGCQCHDPWYPWMLCYWRQCILRSVAWLCSTKELVSHHYIAHCLGVINPQSGVWISSWMMKHQWHALTFPNIKGYFQNIFISKKPQIEEFINQKIPWAGLWDDLGIYTQAEPQETLLPRLFMGLFHKVFSATSYLAA